jgi:DNA-binding PadR family transcriptional regulator
VARSKGTELSVFKGREAKLNRAIFQALALKGPQTIYDIHKRLGKTRGLRYTHYGNANKRVRDLQSKGYVKEARAKSTKAGFEAIEYELTSKAYLALVFDSLKPEDLLDLASEEVASEILAIIVTLFDADKARVLHRY